MSKGWIYILSNNSLKKDLLKIGKTTQTPEKRAAQISSRTGVPAPYVVAYKMQVSDCDTVELWVHNRLSKYRHSKEFFELPLEEAIKVVSEVVSKLKKTEMERKITTTAAETSPPAARTPIRRFDFDDELEALEENDTLEKGEPQPTFWDKYNITGVLVIWLFFLLLALPRACEKWGVF